MAFVRQQMEQGIPSFQLADETIDDVFRLRGDTDTAAELVFLRENAQAYGYVLEDGMWVLQR